MTHVETTLKELNKDYQLVHKQPEAAVFIVGNAMICELLVPYITIEKFQELFAALSDIVVKFGIVKFIFDKRSLRTFHQPSMEWYFVFWKEEMYKKGLTIHRKILPVDKDWFAEAVLAGREYIKEKYPDCIAFKLDMAYVNSVEEGLNN
jgi:hypothetical protein